MKAYLKKIAYYLPKNVVSNDDLIKDFPEWSVEKIASKVGVKKRHCVAEDETALDLALKAAEKIFEDGQVKKEDIDYILFCTQSPDYLLPTSACVLQERLGLSTHIGALDFNLGCSGYVYGLSLAKGLICANIAKNILLVTGETYTKYLHKKDKGNRSIFGDAATATIVSTQGYAEILDFSLGTDGSGAKNLIVKNGGSKNPLKTGEISWDDNNNPISPDYLYMSGNDIFVFTLEAVPSLVRDTLKNNNLQKDQIALFVFHQANKFILDYLRKKMKIEVERFCYCLEDFGNTVSSTIPIALYEAINDGQIKDDMNVLIAGFGVGYSWGGTVLSFKK